MVVQKHHLERAGNLSTGLRENMCMCVLRANKYFWLMGLEKLYRGVRSDRLQYPGDRIVYLFPRIYLSITMARCYPGGS